MQKSGYFARIALYARGFQTWLTVVIYFWNYPWRQWTCMQDTWSVEIDYTLNNDGVSLKTSNIQASYKWTQSIAAIKNMKLFLTSISQFIQGHILVRYFIFNTDNIQQLLYLSPRIWIKLDCHHSIVIILDLHQVFGDRAYNARPHRGVFLYSAA